MHLIRLIFLFVTVVLLPCHNPLDAQEIPLEKALRERAQNLAWKLLIIDTHKEVERKSNLLQHQKD